MEPFRSADSPPGTGWFARQVGRGRLFVSRDVWKTRVEHASRLRAAGYRVTRVLYLAGRGLNRNSCMTQASALTYITVLSLVPLLALAFSVAKGFGAYDHLVANTIEPFLDSTFGAAETDGPDGTHAALPAPAATPSGDSVATGLALRQGSQDGEAPGQGSVGQPAPRRGSPELRSAADKMLNFVNRTNFSNLGMLGLLFLVLAAVKLLTGIEKVFNSIWGVKRSRSLVRKVTDYVALVVVAPILLLIATAVTGAVQSNSFVAYLTAELHMGPALTICFKMIPLIAIWIGFGFLYMSLPNTRVNITSALIGGVLGGSLWQLMQVLHVQFQMGVARYNAIYSGFAAFPIFLVWVYMGWVTVLLGAQVAWAHQAEPAYRDRMGDVPATGAAREQLAVHAARAIAAAFMRGAGVLSFDVLAAQFAVPPRALADALAPLVERGIVARTDRDGRAGYVPARQLDQVRIQDILDAVRGVSADSAEDGDELDVILRRLREDSAVSTHNVTLADLVAVASKAAQSDNGSGAMP